MQAWEEINFLRRLVEKRNAELAVADNAIRIVREEKIAAEMETQRYRLAWLAEKAARKDVEYKLEAYKLPPCKTRPCTGEVRSIRLVSTYRLGPDEIFQRIEADAASLMSESEEELAHAEALFDAPLQEVTTVLGRCIGFPYREQRRPGVWSLKGLGVT